MQRPSSRAPWWVIPLAACFFGYAALVHYCNFFGPRLGMEVEPAGTHMVVRQVIPGLPADRSGLEDGDRLLSVDDRPLRNPVDWSVICANFEAGRAVRLRVEPVATRAAGENGPVVLLLTPEAPSWRLLGRVRLALRVVLACAQLVTLILALVVAFGRPRDRVARLGALFLAAVGTMLFSAPYGFATAWRSLPALPRAVLWIPFLVYFFSPPLLFSFFALFPRPLFRARRALVLAWLPWLVTAPPIQHHYYLMLRRPEAAFGALPGWYLPATAALGGLYVVGGLLAMAMNYRRLEDVNERRRVRVLVIGSSAGFLAILPSAVLLTSGSAPGGSGESIISLPAQLAAAILFLLFPLSFAYTVLRHRLFDVRMMIRRGLQYALARGLLVSLVPALGGVFFADLLVHRHTSMSDVLERRGWVYFALGGLVLLVQGQRKRWLEALDRRFFRDRYDARRLLREIVEDVRQADSLERMAPRVAGRIEAALHPEFAALLLRQPRQAVFRVLAASPGGQAPPDLPAEGKLLGLVRLLGKPVEVNLSETGWLKQRLPHEETDFLRQSRLGLIVPIASPSGSAEVLLALGLKRSEEPYSQEDQELLMAIAASLAMLLERPSEAAARLPVSFEECPVCGACYDSDSGHCQKDGETLVVTPAPRQLAGRYRLERRIGQGGMGTVYEAADTALERRVAVKLIRDDLVRSGEAAERFQREARVAAGFAHPNLVMVHDFGLAAGHRPFFVMELLSGKTLRAEMREQGRLAAARTLDILRGVCAAVEAAHRRHLIHRDLKPENIFLADTEAGEFPKILDFGVAKLLPSATQLSTADTAAGVLVGTPRYMAPEQLRGESPSPAWDLWALTLVTYEMLTGAYPFSGPTAPESLQALMAGRFVSISTHLPDAPPALQHLFEKSFHAYADRRPPSARAFFSELERAVER